MLSIFIIIPLITVIAIFLSKSNTAVKISSLLGMGIQLISAIVLFIMFLTEKQAGNIEKVIFLYQLPWFKTLGISYFIGVDGISVIMILLTSIVIFCGILASWEVTYRFKEFFISLIILATGAFGFFISLDLFVMFFFFEIAVIPMYLLIGIWGSGKKEYSAMKLTLMLMGGSALLLVGIIGIYFFGSDNQNYTFNILQLSQATIPEKAQWFLFPLTFIGFGIIGALFPLHTWSPDGHSSAPTAASMLHAGVLMKLGGYGCLKVSTYLMPVAAQEWSWVFIILATTGIVYGAFATLMQTDLKYINAYSSVSHCALVLFGIAMLTKSAMTGAVLQMFSHGIMTALFFALIGMIYGRTKTRNINEMSGLIKVIPFLGAAYVIGGLCSLGLPGLSGFVAELTIFIGSFQKVDFFYRFVTILATTSIVVTAVYILRVVGKFLLGPVISEAYYNFPKARWYEKVSTGLLVITIILVGSFPFWFSELIQESIQPIIINLTR